VNALSWRWFGLMVVGCDIVGDLAVLLDFDGIG
jgi:hypothetical protein